MKYSTKCHVYAACTTRNSKDEVLRDLKDQFPYVHLSHFPSSVPSLQLYLHISVGIARQCKAKNVQLFVIPEIIHLNVSSLMHLLSYLTRDF